MRSKVFLVEADGNESPDSLERKIELLWNEAGLAEAFAPNDLAAIKLHVGEPGTKTFVPPGVVAPFVARVAATGAQPFLTDSAVLYKSPRDNGVGHAKVALEHGFTPQRMGAPFIPADGLDGSDAQEVEVKGIHFQKVSIASAIVRARSMLVISHATGHLGTGFGGALKNLGMGCCSRMAKLRQHHGQQPWIDEDRCNACSTCAEWCPTDAIAVDEHAVIDGGRCIGCGECIAACREGAVAFDWGIMGRQLQERIVEHAAGVALAKTSRIAYVTVAQRITRNCDCLEVAEEPMIDDIGILASFDPVAIDSALLELVKQRSGQSLEALSYPQHDASIQLRYAEAMGLGSAVADIVVCGY